MEFFEREWQDMLPQIVQLTLAFLFTLPIALDREKQSRSMGLRTFPIVAVASAGFVLISRSIMADNSDAQARIIQGLMTGIGFIGGGAILKEDGAVAGTATAASIWSTGAIGGAVAYSHYEIAFLIAFFNFALLRFLAPIKTRLKETDEEL